jgi:hypothetical protein
MQLVSIPGACVAAYVLPSVVALVRPLPATDRWHIALCNLLFGWTIVAWGICLWWAMAYTGKHDAAASNAMPFTHLRLR